MAETRRKDRSREEDDRYEGLLEGRNAISEALQAGTGLEKLYVANGAVDATLRRLTAKARERGIPVVQCDRRKLDAMSATGAHQGVIAACSAVEYVPLEELLERARQRGEAPLLVLCDGITDPHNLGAIIRTCEVVGAHGVIVPKRRSAGINAACAKAAAGALEYLPVAKVSNLQQTIEDLKARGIAVVAADMGGQTMYGTDLARPTAIVIGAEGAGISRMVREQSDCIVSIPQKGRIQSLNASNAAAVLLYEALRQRG